MGILLVKTPDKIKVLRSHYLGHHDVRLQIQDRPQRAGGIFHGPTHG
jgi:hypothetical protein